MNDSGVDIFFHKYSPLTYLAYESKNIEAAYAHQESPRRSKHSKPIELSEEHDVHH